MEKATRLGPIGDSVTIKLSPVHAWKRLYERWNPPGRRRPSYQGSKKDLRDLVHAQIDRGEIPYGQIIKGLRFPPDEFPDKQDASDTDGFRRTVWVEVAPRRFECTICCKVVRPQTDEDPGEILVKTFFSPEEPGASRSPRRHPKKRQ